MHGITLKLLKIDRYMLRGVWQALNCLSIHGTYCVIIAGASSGETKMWAAVRENIDFFAFGKLLKIDGYMLQGVWQALNCLSIHATYCVIVAGASLGETKMWAVVRENGDFVTVVNYTIFAAIVDSFMSN